MAGTSMDQFEAYFRRADLDGDGRISGAEAVGFFQGSNLPKNVLAQIWMHADQAKTGFLGRAEFFNALKLVTVAQSKRDLTTDIVKAALYGPAAAKIPAPQINLAALSPPQSNTMTVAPPPLMGAAAATSSQNFGFRGQGFPSPILNQQYPSQQNQIMRPPQPVPASTASHPPQLIAGPQLSVGGGVVGPNVPNSNISSDWFSRTNMAPTQPRGISPSVPSSTSTLQTPVPAPSQQTAIVSKALVVSGNGFSSNSAFGNDLFSAPLSIPKQEPGGQNYSASSAPTSSAITPVSSGSQPSSKQNALDSLHAFSLQSTSGQFQQAQSSLNRSQQSSAPGSSLLASSGISVGHGNATSDNSHIPWPKMKPSDVQKYTKVFMQVDTDRDGKITGEQARNLFLSWRLPRDVLKQVWDLSDQDNDSMLSLREFCFALYMMEQYREGRPLPPALPSNVLYDETLLSMTGQPKMTYGNAAWAGPGLGQQQGMPGSLPMAPATGLRPPIQGSSPQADDIVQANQQKSRARVLEDSFLNQSDNMELNVANSNGQEATTTGKKVEKTENLILDSKEKMEFYRPKMQELVLYKSRCDNRLNEITERALADKCEAESLSKKYEEKYKQVAEIASKLTIEEAKFRDIQERKTELHQAIVKMEQGGSVDGILQVRADRVQTDLEELMRAVTERCKKNGVDVKSSAIVELPIGWQPEIPEGAAEWDEDWDKFEDEGFVNDLALDVKNVSSKTKPAFIQTEQNFLDDNASHGSSLDTKGNQDRSPHDSPAGRTAFESLSQDFSDVHFEKSSEADAETHRSFDDSTWGAFDNNDDVDSVWGFNDANTKNSDTEKQRDFFGSDSFGLSPVKTASPHADSIFQTKSPFTFEDSVPGTPLSKFGNSPRYSEAGDHFDNLSRFDSFSMHDARYSSHPEKLTRFDSISSGQDFGYNSESFTRFDSISGSRDFGHNHGRLTGFESTNSTRDFSHSGAFSLDDTDPFGSSGPFKVSSDSETPKRSSDNWSAF
ncbi:Calcium-binding ef-hand-containing protein [Quillaja saponaria]|uniref:Calcium-binding ef-hand-containing protein n=1 Tax=Quillaja saponaria TaxID=32244 RepID=A0AAD7PJK8_QUISA|nr:Calcium-binding ef-hand-containing protein [Quillaja saponaria]